jgi:hypothetical protein
MKRPMATAGWHGPTRLIPPNVFPFEHDGLMAKYAVLSEADFRRLNGPETRNVSVWARFAQPHGWCGVRMPMLRQRRLMPFRVPRQPCSRLPVQLTAKRRSTGGAVPLR